LESATGLFEQESAGCSVVPADEAVDDLVFLISP
jgi:hypothetical protein